MQSINQHSLHTLTPAGVLIGTAFLRHGEPRTIHYLGIGASDPTKEPTSRWRERWPGEDDMVVRDYQLAMVFLGYDDGEKVDSLIITLGPGTPSMLPPKDGPPSWIF